MEEAIILLLAALCWGILPSSSALSHRSLLAIVPPTPLTLTYHNGTLLASPFPIDVYLLWYGSFTPPQQSIISDFFSSLSPSPHPHPPSPSVASWWSITSAYKDASGSGVSPSLRISRQAFDPHCSLGKDLQRSDLLALINKAIYKRSLPFRQHAIYLVLTAADVAVERFCVDSCGFHASTAPSARTHNRRLVYGWVGNPGVQCPGECAWPFAVPEFGPPNPPLVSPNADVGVDGMIINIATILAGAATDPYRSGFYEGDAELPLEAVSACRGIYGEGAYPGYAGEVLVDARTGASYNAIGIRDREFLLPAMWDPHSLRCSTTSS